MTLKNCRCLAVVRFHRKLIRYFCIEIRRTQGNSMKYILHRIYTFPSVNVMSCHMKLALNVELTQTANTQDELRCVENIHMIES